MVYLCSGWRARTKPSSRVSRRPTWPWNYTPWTSAREARSTDKKWILRTKNQGNYLILCRSPSNIWTQPMMMPSWARLTNSNNPGAWMEYEWGSLGTRTNKSFDERVERGWASKWAEIDDQQPASLSLEEEVGPVWVFCLSRKLEVSVYLGLPSHPQMCASKHNNALVGV